MGYFWAVAARKVITHVVYSGIGGHGNVMRSFIDADAKGDFDYAVLFYGVEPLRDEYKEWVTTREIPFRYVHKNPGVDVSYVFRFIGALLALRSHVVFLHGAYNILFAKVFQLFKNSTIIVRETQNNGLKTKSDWWFLRQALRYANAVVFLHDTYHEEVKLHFGMSFSNIHVIPNGVNTEVFNHKLRQREPSIPFVFSMVSRIVPIKDHSTLLRAFSRLQKLINTEVELRIGGDGTMLEKLKHQVAEEGIEHVVFLGEITESQIVLLLSESDVYVHATFGETMSTSLLQAGAMGCPIIASDVSGVKEQWLHNEYALLVPVEKPVELAKAMEQLVMDIALRKALSERAQQLVGKRYSNRCMFAAYKQLILSD